MNAHSSIRDHFASLDPRAKAELDKTLAAEIAVQRSIDEIAKLRNWSPRHYQERVWAYLTGGGKRANLCWHRRSGKDDVALNWTCRAAHERVGEYWHMLPEAAQARRAIWDAVNPHTGIRRIDQAFPASVRQNTRKNDMVIEFKNGSLWRVVGSDNYNSLLGATPAGVVFSEWALADPSAWAFLRPIFAENGGWAMFIFTPRGDNHAKKLLDLSRADHEWFAEVLSADKTGVFSGEQLAKELREMQGEIGREEGQALFEQEYNCSFDQALVGSYYGSYLTAAQKAGRIGSVPIDRAALVHTAWDLGVADSTAIWFIQVVGKERRLVDYHEASGVGLDEYARVLQAKAADHGWIYGTHRFPHDIEVRELGNQALSRRKTLEGLGIRVKVVEQSNVNDGINATRRMLDAAWIDEKRCERGLNALRNYRRAWNEKTRMYSDSPLHDWTSHGCDALRCFAVDFREAKIAPPVGSGKIPTFGTSRHERGTGWMGR